ncbi:MAG TPA: NAD(P)H-hydrate epimerase, partial [Flavisolibacter sp.]
MQIFSADQVREWDKYTMDNEPVASIDLMERAARACFQWLTSQPWQDKVFRFFCGKGNNGGDGLAIARILLQAGYQVHVHILEYGKPGTGDFQENLRRLHELPQFQVSFMQPGIPLPEIGTHDIVVDAMFGSGLNKPLAGLAADIVDHINCSGAA